MEGGEGEEDEYGCGGGGEDEGVWNVWVEAEALEYM